MKIIWLKSRKWKQDDLDGKLVEFRIVYANAFAEGIGKFLTRGSGIERLAADIVVPHSERGHDNHYHIPDSLFEKIEIHPDRTKADFLVCGQFNN